MPAIYHKSCSHQSHGRRSCRTEAGTLITKRCVSFATNGGQKLTLWLHTHRGSTASSKERTNYSYTSSKGSVHPTWMTKKRGSRRKTTYRNTGRTTSTTLSAYSTGGCSHP